MTDRKKSDYRKPELRVYGEMEQLTRVMWWGLYPDHLGNLQVDRPRIANAPGGNMTGWDMKGMKMTMS